MRTGAFLLVICLTAGLAGCEEAWRGDPPRLGSLVSVQVPRFTEQRLPCGATVISRSDGMLPLVSVDLALRAPPSLQGDLGGLLLRLLLGQAREGQIGEGLDALGAVPSVSTDADVVSIGVQVFAQDALAAALLLGRVVRQPPADEALLRELLAGMERGDRPETAAAQGERALREQMFGARHPYGRWRSGVAEGVTVAELAEYQRRLLVPARVALVLAGRISDREALGAARVALSWLPAVAAEPEAEIELPPPPAKTQVLVLRRPGVHQVQLWLGRALFAPGHPDEEALQLGTALYSARLFSELRAQRGLSYTPWAGLRRQRGVVSFVAHAAVDATQAGQALRLMLDQLDAARVRSMNSVFAGRGESLLITVRSQILFHRVAALDGLRGDVAQMAGSFLLGRPADDFLERYQRTQQTELVPAVEALSKYVRPEFLHVVVVGDVGPSFP